MTAKLDELLRNLDEIIELLDSDGERHWSSWLRHSRERLSNSDHSGIELLLSAYGGMGSFNDLVIGQNNQNGQFRWKDGHVETNNRLNELRENAWELADSIRRDHFSKDT